MRLTQFIIAQVHVLDTGQINEQLQKRKHTNHSFGFKLTQATPTPRTHCYGDNNSSKNSVSIATNLSLTNHSEPSTMPTPINGSSLTD